MPMTAFAMFRQPIPKTFGILLFLSCASVSGCKRESSVSSVTPTPVASSQVAPAAAPVAKLKPGPHSPMTMEELPTTDGQIAIDNLSGSVRTGEALALARPTDPVARVRQIALLSARAQYLGTLADYERAEQWAQQLQKIAPKSTHALLASAQLHSTYHEFAEALSDLAAAEKLDPELVPLIKERRANILRALGKHDEALTLYQEINRTRPDISTLGEEASLRGELGQLEAAEQLFISAQEKFVDVTPFPLAWLYFQQGLMWENAGNLARAQVLYQAAVERLPCYAAAVAHLAGIEEARAQKDSAVARLKKLLLTADDPEYKGQLAALLTSPADAALSSQLRTEAQKQYEVLLKKKPRAFAGHAVRFYSAAGGDAKTALVWAEKNLGWLKSPAALTLATEAALAAGESARACTFATQLQEQSKHLADREKVIAVRAFLACGQKERAAALLPPVQ